MVYAFMIQSVSNTPASSIPSPQHSNIDDPSSALLHSTEASVILATFYTPEGNDDKKRQRIKLLSQQIHQDYVFHLSLFVQSHFTSTEETMSGRTSSRLRDLDGEFLLSPNEIVSSPKVIVWHHVGSCTFAVVCEYDENRQLAFNFLSNFLKAFKENSKAPQLLQSNKDILAGIKAEELIAMAQTYLPAGQLLFSGDSLARHLRRELENALSTNK
eukprot:TRINITY_DN13251_c0_g1_i1.p1 TRINITY_DN13251_c0_g1~~TRINITY_DN13251_c0_g1_i1.p1  ORF type:complete len:215 (-),score=41.25 TRINITY_DN13251_c0_g1_i1:100-744(-)